MTWLANDRATLVLASLLSLLILLVAVWRSPYLPMQDYPQHLLMASIANDYGDPQLGWQENFELRHQAGPYRASHLALRAFGALTDMQTAGRMLITLYLLLVAALVWRLQSSSEHTVWAALLLFPLSMHAMYFYGFLNFTLSIPVLVLALLQLRSLLSSDARAGSLLLQLCLVMALFMLHPYTLQVYIVLAIVTTLMLARDKSQFASGAACVLLAALIFLGWTSYNAEESPGAVFALHSLNMKWWPLEWRLGFLGMSFSGLNINGEPDLLAIAAWSLIPVVFLTALVLGRASNKPPWVITAWFTLALAGYFVLPFSIHLDARYTFFGIRMAPVAFFLLVLVLSPIRLGPLLGRTIAVISLALVLMVANLHLKVAAEQADNSQLFRNMAPHGRVLSLIGSARSEHLDPFFYANFHYYFPFYYHLEKGGGINPDMFSTRLMPVGYRTGRRPPPVHRRSAHRWAEHRHSYDYVITRGMPTGLHRNILLHGRQISVAGPWRVYELDAR